MDVLSDEIKVKNIEVEEFKRQIQETIKEEAKEKNDIENLKKDIVDQKEKIAKLNKNQTGPLGQEQRCTEKEKKIFANSGVVLLALAVVSVVAGPIPSRYYAKKKEATVESLNIGSTKK